MLKLNTLHAELARLAELTEEQVNDRAARRAKAIDSFRRHTTESAALAARADAAKTSWLIAEIVEPPHTIHAAPPPPAEHTVIAVDGSQIFPDRHGAALWFVINLGRVTLRYGADSSATLDSRPLLFADEQDLYRGEVGERHAVGANEVSLLRGVLELEELLALAAEQTGEVVAVADGTLIPWMIDPDKDDWHHGLHTRWLAALDGFRELGVPVASYISRSGASDVIHLVRVGDCDRPRVDCDQCEHLRRVTSRVGSRNLTVKQAGELPCGTPAGLADSDLWGELLAGGERSAWFLSRSKSFDRREDARVGFCYVATGDEIARLEMPRWVAENEGMRDRVHAVIVDQVAKGRGYPVALQEAHEQAVVRGGDRQVVEQLLERSLIARGVRFGWSRKSGSKRQPGV